MSEDTLTSTPYQGNKKIFLHVGLHKTGTTFLQKNIFKNLNGVDYLHSNHTIKSLIGRHESLLLSCESFSGVSFLQNKANDYYSQFVGNLQYLKSLFPNAKVIIGFREPSSLLRSFYKQHLQQGGTLSFDEFFNLADNGLIRTDELLFSRFYDAALEIFGDGNCFFYDQAELALKQGIVLVELVKFLNATLNGKELLDKKENVSVPDNFENILLKLNRVDKWFKHIFGISLNNSLSKKFRLTPRNLCQDHLPRIVKAKKNKHINVIQDYYLADWSYVRDKVRLSQ